MYKMNINYKVPRHGNGGAATTIWVEVAVNVV